MYTTILFDLDGTLLDPKEGITRSVHYALLKLGIVENNLDTLIPFIGPPLSESFQRNYNLDEQKTKQAVTFYRERFEKMGIYETKIYDGVEEMLQILNKNNKKLFVVTSKPTYFTKKILNNLNLTKYFVDIFGASMNIIGEKKTDTMKEVLEKYPPKFLNEIVMVGDREHDIIAANNHAIASIGVTYGYGTKEELEKAKPSKIVNSPKELLKILLLDNNQTSLL